MDTKLKQVFGFTAVVVAISLALTAPALAVGDYPYAAARYRHGRKDITKTLALTPGQKEQIEKQRSMNMQNWNKLREEFGAKRLELKQELEKTKVDMNRIHAIIAEMKTLQGEQLELRVNNILAMKQILTPEQFRKLQEKKFKHDMPERKALQ